MKYLLCVLLFVCSFVYANEGLYIVGGGISKHYKDDQQNEVHPSIGLEYDGMSILYTSKNSIEKESFQISYSDNFWESSVVDIGYRIGIATGYSYGTKYHNNERYYDGYEIGNTGLLPIVALEFTLHTFIPNFQLVADVAPTVTMFGFKYKI